MKAIRQLVRQPVKFLSGVIAVSLAVCILCVCLGQSLMAKKTGDALDDQFTTAALPTAKYNFFEQRYVNPDGSTMWYTRWSDTLPEEIENWILNTVETRPDLVEFLASPGLASAFIPELKPENLTGHPYDTPNVGSGLQCEIHDRCGKTTYAGAMLEMVLEEIQAPKYYTKDDIAYASYENFDDWSHWGTPVDLKGTVKSVVSLEEGYDDPTGRTIYVRLRVPDLDALNLEPGERYLVCGPDYLDGQWALRTDISRELSRFTGNDVFLEELDDSCFTSYNESVLLEPNSLPDGGPYYVAYYNASGYQIGLQPMVLRQRNAVFLTAHDKTVFPVYERVEGNGQSHFRANWERWITDEAGNRVQISQDEYRDRYSVPTVAHLTGSVEDFLRSEQGSAWAEQLDLMKVNYQAFPVIGVEKLGYVAEFSRQNARIVEGRDFTRSELRSGAKVCVIAQSLAAKNGLTVGDKITPQFYNYDWDSPYQDFLSSGIGVFRPTAYSYTDLTEFVDAGEEYTIVGLYRQNNPWDNAGENMFTFTPNTVFVPKASVPSDMDYSDHGFFRTLILQNGAIPEFRALMEGAGYEDLFVFYDQGYSEIASSLHDYGKVSTQAMVIGIIVYGVILALFLLLFPGGQGRTLATMRAIGTGRKKELGQVFWTGAGILIPGTVLGTAAGMLLWQKGIQFLTKRAGSTLSLELDLPVFLAVTLAQLALALLLTLLLAVPMTADTGIKKRK